MPTEVLCLLLGLFILSIINQKKDKSERKSIEDIKTKKYYPRDITNEDRARWIAEQPIEMDTELGSRVFILAARAALLTKELWYPLMVAGILIMITFLLTI